MEGPNILNTTSGSNKTLNAFCFFAGALIVFTIALYLKFSPEPVTVAEPTSPPTPEAKAYVVSAHRLGTRLYAVGKRITEKNHDPVQQQTLLQPVYTQIEDFIAKRLAGHSNSISSIRVIYRPPTVECTVFVKPTSEEELQMIKTMADKCVGRILENLPIVQYLMVRNEEPIQSSRQVK